MSSSKKDTNHCFEYWLQASNEKTRRYWLRRLLMKKMIWSMTYRLAEMIKRGIDLIGSLSALVLLSPVFFITALWIKLEDGGPIFFKQIRVGHRGKSFYIWKFRSMVLNADCKKESLLAQNQHKEGITFKIKNDPRITRVGRFIRRYSIDEFPQFYNVLIGDMALVGPRPPVPSEVALYKAAHLRRLMVKPGITCLWQIGGRSELDFESQVRLDLKYIRSESVLGDIRILLKTIPAVLSGKGAY